MYFYIFLGEGAVTEAPVPRPDKCKYLILFISFNNQILNIIFQFTNIAQGRIQDLKSSGPLAACVNFQRLSHVFTEEKM